MPVIEEIPVFSWWIKKHIVINQTGPRQNFFRADMMTLGSFTQQDYMRDWKMLANRP